MKGPTFHLEQWVDLVVMVMGTQMEMEAPMAMTVAHMEMGDQMGMETLQSMEIPRRKETPKEGEEVQVVMGNLVGVETPQLEEEDLSEKMGIQME